MWPSSATTRHVNYGLPPEFFVVAPASSFHQHHQESVAAAAATTINFDPHGLNTSNAAAIGVIPLLTTTPCLNMGSTDEDLLGSRNRSGMGMQLWQNQELQQNPSPYSKKPIFHDHNILLQSGSSSGGGGGGGGGSSSGATTCQDCGNQAKKDCSRRRCRTCCRSRGYDCATHLKSTWVPAARRRERLGVTTTTAGSSQSTSGVKKPRLGTSLTTTASHTSTSNNTPPRSFDTSSSHQGGSFKEPFPGQVRAPAVFKCVKVTAVDDGDDEYAYQAVVRIGGHVFKGFLYDQGVESRDGFPNISDLHLGGIGGVGGGGGGGGTGGGDARNGASSSSPVINTSDVYASGGGGLLGGSNYGIPIN